MALKLITPPAALAVALADVKTQLRIDGTEHDATLTAYIEAATKVAEHETGRRFITQTWEAVYDAFPCGAIELGLSPVQSVTSIKYLDVSGVEQTVSIVDYVLDPDQSLGIGYVLPAIDLAWPAAADSVNAVRVRFVAGYGASSAAVPANARVWITLAVSEMFNGCGAGALDAMRSNPLLDDLRVYR